MCLLNCIVLSLNSFLKEVVAADGAAAGTDAVAAGVATLGEEGGDEARDEAGEDDTEEVVDVDVEPPPRGGIWS